MKKLISVAIAGVAATACAFALTACGGDKETTYTVTADEWKTAVALLTDANTSVDCTWKYAEDELNADYFMTYDIVNQALKFKYVSADESIDYLYAWKGDNSDYFMSSTSDTISKIDEQEFKTCVNDNFYEYAGGIILKAIKNKFADFSYSEEKKEYSCTINETIPDYAKDGVGVNLVVKFENAKIVSMVSTHGNSVYTFTYKYDGVTVTVPDNIKNLPVTE